jgi:HK97 family phage portal protein
MIDALDKAFAEADSMVANCKAASVASVVTASAGFSLQRPLSLVESQEQLLHFRGWVWSAVRLVAQRIAGQLVCVGNPPAGSRYKSSMGQRIEPLDSHPLLDALADPNPWMSYWQLMFTALCSLEVTGRAVLWVSKGKDRTSIFFLATPWITEIDPLQTWWKVRPTYAQQEFTIPGDEIVNIHYPSCEGYHPNDVISPLARVAEAVLTDQQIQTAQHAAFKNGIFPSVILTAGKLPGMGPGIPGERPTLTSQQREDLIATIRAAYRGVNSAGEPLIIDSLIESIEKFSQTVMEMDFGNSSKITKSRVLQGYGVSPILLGELENANRASSTVAEEIFIYNKINPLIQMISGTLTQRLAPMFASPREKLTCWIEQARPHDADLFIKEWELAMRFGAASRNDYRINVLNMPAAEGLDEYLEPAGFLPSQLGNDNNSNNGNNDNKPAKHLNGHRLITITG